MVHIEDIPALVGKRAVEFERRHEMALKREKIDFSKEYHDSMKLIHKKDKIKESQV